MRDTRDGNASDERTVVIALGSSAILQPGLVGALTEVGPALAGKAGTHVVMAATEKRGGARGHTDRRSRRRRSPRRADTEEVPA